MDSESDGGEPKVRLTVEEKILLLMNEHQRYKKDYDVPNDLTQQGIAAYLGTGRGNVPREIRKLKDKGLIFERIAHIKGSQRRQKGYPPHALLPDEHQFHNLVRSLKES